jgi:hypothetical protein
MDAREGAAVPSRRSLLKGGIIAAAGALSWGASAATRGGVAKSSGATELSLQGARLRSMSGELVGSGDRAIGSFSATHLAVPPAGSDTPGTELQTFSLDDGSIFGLGTPPVRGDGPAVYAVLGGTGRYAGVSGTYLADRRPIDRGGDGTAEFKFTFANYGEASDRWHPITSSRSTGSRERARTRSTRA